MKIHEGGDEHEGDESLLGFFFAFVCCSWWTSRRRWMKKN